ncbi:thiol reductant ABC exporter subunit CydD [Gleimia sp. 6138-11-ORH1]|uniref:thiol reductant ABC exporter subunit CydD n=1 Tax=Gleimia sp. 6138-11-ORH1 TaxID=2973937 RepID=UPI00216A61A2|nr:thiol reductant ABC exporter subunit CydD [Gleimia sp. 6138-11-ORH1]MCS4484505.1 thiol reductant ABC exporter subunit CydD [Gleimia sp. 6138-11-ORH1]
MKPLDQRLLKYAQSARQYMIFIVFTGTLGTLLTIAQILAISATISPIITGEATFIAVFPTILILVSIVIARLALTYIHRAYAHRAANQAIAQLRKKVLAQATALGPRWLSTHATDTVTLTTRGLDDLGPYFVAYLPQLVLTLIATPLVLAVMLYLDLLSAFIAVITIPLIPIFMILVGKLTEEYSLQKLKTMERLGSQLLDLISGLPTLKALGREQAPTNHVKKLGQTHARTTMQTLRVAFLSGGILEFIATLSVALVAVEVGVRLVYGNVSLFAGLAIIMLAPEVYAPLREVGKNYHASADGVAAANAAFEIIETPLPAANTQQNTVTSPQQIFTDAVVSPIEIQFVDVSIAARGAWAPHQLNAIIPAGSITALSGVSGAGKTSTVMAILGLLPLTQGKIWLSVPTAKHPAKRFQLEEIALENWWEQITWVPQAPAILPGSVLENVTQTNQYPPATLAKAAQATGFDSVIASLADGWHTQLGHAGIGLSVGQRQRLALTRALLNPTPLIILDEPTAHLDSLTEKQVIETIKKLQAKGSTVLVIAHRKAVLEVATHVIEITSQSATTAEIKQFPQLQVDTVEVDNLLATPHLLHDLLKAEGESVEKEAK